MGLVILNKKKNHFDIGAFLRKIKMILLSIVIPFYNAEKFLLRNVESIIHNQKFDQNIEIIYVSDGSTDGSELILAPYLKKYHNIHLICTTKRGASAARNEGVNNSHGEFITFCDVDDYYKDSFLTEIANALFQKKTDILLFGYESRTLDGLLLSTNLPEKIDSFIYPQKVIVGHRIGGFVWNKIYRKSLLKNVKFDVELSICEDMHFNISVYNKNNELKIGVISKALYVYTSNPNSSSREVLNLFDPNGNFKYAQAFSKISPLISASLQQILDSKLFMCSVMTLSENTICDKLSFTQIKTLKKISMRTLKSFVLNRDVNKKKKIVFLAYFFIPSLKLIQNKLKKYSCEKK